MISDDVGLRVEAVEVRDRLAEHGRGVDAALGELALRHDVKVGNLRQQHGWWAAIGGRDGRHGRASMPVSCERFVSAGRMGERARRVLRGRSSGCAGLILFIPCEQMYNEGARNGSP